MASNRRGRALSVIVLSLASMGLMACQPVAGSGSAGSKPAAGVPEPNPNVVPAGVTGLGDFTVYCYIIQGRTATGVPTSTEVVAVDPKVIPLRSRIFIKGVGWRTALDTGGSIKGRKLDIWLPSAEACRNFGTQTLAVYRPA